MNWKRFFSVAVLVAAGAAGCPNGRTGPASQTGPTGPTASVEAESMKERLANQARAIVELSADNENLLAKIEKLRAEVARLEAQLKERSASAPAAGD